MYFSNTYQVYQKIFFIGIPSDVLCMLTYTLRFHVASSVPALSLEHLCLYCDSFNTLKSWCLPPRSGSTKWGEGTTPTLCVTLSFKRSKWLQFSQEGILSRALLRRVCCGMEVVPWHDPWKCIGVMTLHSAPPSLASAFFFHLIFYFQPCYLKGFEHHRAIWESVRNVEPRSHPRLTSSESTF